MIRPWARLTFSNRCGVVVVAVLATLALSGGTLYAQCLDSDMWGVFPTASALFGFDKQPDSKTTALDAQGHRYYRISWPSGSSSGGAMFKLTLYASAQVASDAFQQRKNAVSGSTDIQIGDEGYTFGPPTPYYLVRKKCTLIEAYFVKFAKLLQPTDSYLNDVVNAIDHLSCQPCHGGSTPPPPPSQEICDNNVDDDGDGLVDGADPDCAVAVAVRLGYTPTQPTPIEPVCISATYTNPQGYPFTYKWWYRNSAINEWPDFVPLNWNERGGCFPHLPQTVSDHLIRIEVVFQTPQGVTPSSDSLSLRTAYKDLSVALELRGDLHAGQPMGFGAYVSPATNATLTPPIRYTWSLDGVIRSDWSTESAIWALPTPGAHTVKLEVQDAAGNTGWNSATFSVSDAPSSPPTQPGQNHPPKIASLSYTPTPVVVGQAVTFRASASDEDGDALNYEWYVNGAKKGWTGASPTWSAVAAGRFTVEVVVTDGQGGSVQKTTTLTVGAASLIDQFLLTDTMGSDGTPGVPKNNFNCGDTVYAFLRSTPVSAPHHVELTWKDPQAQVVQSSKGDFGQAGSAGTWTLSDHLTTDDHSGPGSWTVELYLDGGLDRSVTFALGCDAVKRAGPVVEAAFMTGTVSSDGQPGPEQTSFGCNDPVYVWIHTSFENPQHTVDVGWYDPQGQQVAGTGWGYTDSLPIWIWHALPEFTPRTSGRWTVRIAIDGAADRTLDFTLSCGTNVTPRRVEQVMDQDHDGYLNDDEILNAIQYWILGKPLPGMDQRIDDQEITRLIQMWIVGSPV